MLNEKGVCLFVQEPKDGNVLERLPSSTAGHVLPLNLFFLGLLEQPSFTAKLFEVQHALPSSFSPDILLG